MNIQQIKIEEIIPYDKNPRINNNAVKSLSESIKQFGFQQPLVLDKNKVIIVGHTRYKAAKELGLTELPCQVADELTEEQVKAYRILDNDNKSTWNYELLKFEIEELQDLGFDLEPFDTNLLQEAITETDKLKEVTDDEFIEEEPENIFIKKGDLLELGGHRVLCGDSTSAEDVAELMQGKKAELMFTDPPYGVKMDKGFEGFGGFGPPIARRRYEEDWDTERPTQETFNLLLQVAINSIIWGGQCFADILPQGKHWIVWDKKQTMPTFGDCELAWTNIKRYSIKKYEVVYNGLIGREKERYHPTQKPIKLISDILKDYSDNADTIADPFLGSGTTLIAADQLGRICYGMEISEKYCQVILDRWCKYREKEGKPIDAKINGETYKA